MNYLKTLTLYGFTIKFKGGNSKGRHNVMLEYIVSRSCYLFTHTQEEELGKEFLGIERFRLVIRSHLNIVKALAGVAQWIAP